jgi:hypothetical protein
MLDGGGDGVGVDQGDVGAQPGGHCERGRQQQPAVEMPGQHGRQQQTQGRGKTQQREVIEPRQEHETEENAAADAAEAVGKVDPANGR